MSDSDYEVLDIPNEPRVEFHGQRWDYVKVVYADGRQKRTYYHVDCDCIVGDNGCCILCGSPSPCTP